MSRIAEYAAALASVAVAPGGDLAVEEWRTIVLRQGLYLPLADNDPDAKIANSYRRAAQEYSDRLQRSADQLLRICVSAEVPGVWLKGWAVRHEYQNPADRLMTDIDLLVPPERLPLLAARLIESGYRSVPGPKVWPVNYEWPLVDPQGVLIELHGSMGRWDLAAPVAALLRWPENGTFFSSLPIDLWLPHLLLHLWQHAGRIKGYQWLDLCVVPFDDGTWNQVCACGLSDLAQYGAELLRQRLQGKADLPAWSQVALAENGLTLRWARHNYRLGEYRWRRGAWTVPKVLLYGSVRLRRFQQRVCAG